MLAAAIMLIGPALTAPPVTAAETPTTVTLTASASTTNRGQFFNLQATVSPNPGGGEVSFYDVGADTCLCSYQVNPDTGAATANIRLMDLGERELKAVFSGHGEFAASESENLPHTVRLRPTTTALTIADPLKDGTMTLRVTVSPVPDGGTFSIHAASGEAVVNAAPADTSDGVQHYVLSAPIAGSGPYTASYSGTFFDAPSQSAPVSWEDDRTPTTTLLEVTPLEGAPFDTFTFEVQVDPDTWSGHGRMEGFVRLYTDGGIAPWATLAVSGNGVADTTRTFPAGAPVIHVEYSGDDEFVRSRSENVALDVQRIVTSTTLELSDDEFHPHQAPITATVTISPPPGTLPSAPVAGLTFVARDGRSYFEAVPIDPDTGIGLATITREELSSEIWTATARFAQAPPVSTRFVPSQSEPVELRYVPFGPEHQLSIRPEKLYDGDPTTIYVVLDPRPPGGTLSLYSTTGTVGVEPTLLGTQPADTGPGPLAFPITVEQGTRYFTRFSGHADIPASQSAELQPEVLLPPIVFLDDPGAWRASSTIELEFDAWHLSVMPVTFECSLDDGEWEDCTSPYTTPTLADGRHTFAVRATDANGREGLHPEEVAWRIDTSDPVVTGIAVASREISDPMVTLTVEATDQTIGLHGQPPQVFFSMSPQVDESGRLAVTTSGRPLGASTIDVRRIQLGGGPDPGERRIYVQVEDAFGHRTEPQAVSVIYAPPGSVPFTDLAGHRFEADAAWLYFAGLTTGCTPTLFCPNDPVNRQQMATFLDRALDLDATEEDFFSDDEGLAHEAAINRLAAAGITTGCGGGRYCPKDPVTRSQMATFLDRALDLDDTDEDFFTDDDGLTHEPSINRIAAAGITTGCGDDKFCPRGIVKRAQMAAFLHRALGD